MTTFDSVHNVWKGPEMPYPFPLNVFLGEEILKAFDERPESIFQIYADNDQSATRKEIKLESIRIAQNLMALGIKANEIIGIICQNSRYISPLLYGCIIIGAPINPLDVSFTKNDMKHMFGYTKPKLVFCDSDIFNTTKEALEELKNDAIIYTLQEKLSGVPHIDELLKPTKNEESFVAPKFEETADRKLFAIICSSGTTGAPKGVCYPHSNALTFIKSLKTPQRTMTLTFSPLYWVTGFYFVLLSPWRCNDTKIITKNSFTPEVFFELLRKHKINVFQTSVMRLVSIFQSPIVDTVDMSSINVLFISGSSLSKQLRNQICEKFQKVSVLVRYGMTEISVTNSLSGIDIKNDYSVGTLSPNVTVKIIDVDGNKLGIGQNGEILAKPKFPFLGYFNNSEATKNAIDDEGFFRTGDVGYFDQSGFLFFVDRLKEIYTVKGYQINPSEIEHEILSIEGVKQVSVVGIPDPIFMALTTAVIVKHEGCNSITKELIINHIASKFDMQKQLHGGVLFVNELPMTSSGKVLKRALRDIVEGQMNASRSPL